MQRLFSLCGTRAATAASLALGLAACGGGGGGGGGSPPPPPPPLSISYSASTITFTAPAPWGPKLADQIITGTLSGSATGTLYIVVQVNNPEIASVPTSSIAITGNNSGQATIVPVLPHTLGSGLHQGTIVVRACLNDPTCSSGQIGGSPATIDLRYDIATTVDRDTVTPRVVDANASGRVVIRGKGFTPATAVAFGAVPASAVSFVSSTELTATHPSLAVGTHAVLLSSGSVPFVASLTAVAPTSFSSVFLPQPVATPASTRSLLYDAERRAIVVAVANQQAQLLRYAYDGNAWSSPLLQATPIDVRQIRLSHDGARVLALRGSELPVRTSLTEYDAVTLAEIADTVFDNMLLLSRNLSIAYGETFALANDGNAVLTMRVPGSGSTPPVVFATARRVFDVILTPESDRFWHSGAPGDGSFVALQTFGGFGHLKYSASNGTLVRLASPTLTTGFEAPLSADLTGSKIQTGTGVGDSGMRPLGYAASTQVAAVVNREGTRLYTADPSMGGMLRTYDITTPASGTGQFPQYPEIGSPLPLAGDPGLGGSTQMTITPDGRAVIIAGSFGIAVQPTPP
jgi:hypothetical protein